MPDKRFGLPRHRYGQGFARSLAPFQPGKDDTARLTIGNGYAKGHSDLSLNILRESPAIRALFEKLYV
ncbi:MAG: hypothetical protein A2087_00080 [Spirochaetes bacterium GWD1_61_31]|nr:MAG: hypothetical protein A2Y37_06755 [Spirochaetes bacterium GWB1_60_80]OHD30775.1 MAG: hypothetical protein A2004_04280 [Spirochaetes bacterium GWC1_61_12]OHD42944.1 MAG: hypothetical protein A2087_00080 [Spirochaetes bacterium GWD1_61_31]OHD46274.1 MAG: hypothetical protein A2Y35_07030 [Spirochaetes bacterium GWE1_60_18]OHD60881.1 MAG: hypothetical protein A2Y32_11775 [Spirochaetes bacterium GWF1_60_12]